MVTLKNWECIRMSEDKQQKRNVPELRFPEFEGEWELNTISHFLKESRIKGHKGGQAKKLTVKLWGKGVVPKNEAFKGSNNTQYYIRKTGQLIYGKLDFLNCAFGIIPDYLNNYESTIDSPSFDVIKGDTKFLLERIKMKSFYKKNGEIANGSRKAKRINQDTFLSMPIFSPSYSEQQKIGSFFSKLDRQIELEEKKLALLEEQKKGYMQKIFSQELRFKDENGNDYTKWKQVTIAEITSYVSSKKSSNQYNENESIQGYPVYDAIREIGKDSHYDMRTPYISILKDGAGVGRLSLRQGKSSVIGTMSYLLPHNTELKFLYYCLKMLNFKKYIIGSTIPHLYYKDYSKEKVFVPTTLEEQEKIGRFVFKLDASINNKSRKIELLKLRKKGLLQKIFI